MRRGDSTDYLSRKLEGGPFQLGELQVSPSFSLCHVADWEREDLELFHDPHDAVEIAKYDSSGQYRPLKTAPNLKRGWRLELIDLGQLLLALNFFYPAAIGTLLDLSRKTLGPVSLRETLSRQTGMYAVTRKITDDQADALIREQCDPETGCLRTILWPLDASKDGPRTAHELPSDFTSNLPILCVEACNLLVAAARKKVKEAAKPA